MFSWLTLAVLLIDPTAARTDVSGGVSGEVRGGWAPVTLNEPSEPAFVFTLTPSIDLRHANRRHGIVSIGYAPRMFIRQPNRLSLQRPLFFHELEVEYDKPISRAWAFRTQAAARVGELDYTAAAVAFDPGQTALPDTSVLSFAIIDGGFGFTGLLGPRTTLTIAPSAGTRRPLGATDVGVRPFPDRVYGNLSIGPRFEVSARDDIALTIIGSVNDFDPGAVFVSGDARVAWFHTLRRNLELAMDAGVFITRVAARQDDNTTNDGATFPVGGMGLNGRLRARSSYQLDGGVAVGFAGLFDAISGRLLYRVRANASLLASFPPRWSAGINAGFITSPTTEPLRVMVGGQPVPETLATIQTPIRYLIDDNKNIEFGGIFGVRAPHLAAQSFDSVRYEAWAYVAFRIGGGTARGGREVRQRRTSS